MLGNFVSRVTKFCRSKFGEEVPAGGAFGAAEQALIADLTARVAEYEQLMDAMEVRKSAAALRAIWAAGNEYLQAAAPWAVVKQSPDDAAAIVRFALNLIALYAALSAPFIPDATAQMTKAMGTDGGWPEDVATALAALKPGQSFTVPENLFDKITDEAREGWEAAFAGQRG